MIASQSSFDARSNNYGFRSWFSQLNVDEPYMVAWQSPEKQKKNAQLRSGFVFLIGAEP